jgi:hypothetical protein
LDDAYPDHLIPSKIFWSLDAFFDVWPLHSL